MAVNRQKAVAAIRKLRVHNVSEFAKSLPASKKHEPAPSEERRAGMTMDLCDDEDDEKKKRDEEDRAYN